MKNNVENKKMILAAAVLALTAVLLRLFPAQQTSSQTRSDLTAETRPAGLYAGHEPAAMWKIFSEKSGQRACRQRKFLKMYSPRRRKQTAVFKICRR